MVYLVFNWVKNFLKKVFKLVFWILLTGVTWPETLSPRHGFFFFFWSDVTAELGGLSPLTRPPDRQKSTKLFLPAMSGINPFQFGPKPGSGVGEQICMVECGCTPVCGCRPDCACTAGTPRAAAEEHLPKVKGLGGSRGVSNEVHAGGSKGDLWVSPLCLCLNH